MTPEQYAVLQSFSQSSGLDLEQLIKIAGGDVQVATAAARAESDNGENEGEKDGEEENVGHGAHTLEAEEDLDGDAVDI